MKIDPNDKLHQASSLAGVRSKQNTQGPSFADVLKETSGAEAAQENSRVSSMPPVMRPLAIDAQQEMYHSTEKALDVLERYQQLLADPKADLRMIDPMVQKMKGVVDKLTPMLNQAGEDSAVKQIAQETLLTVSKEIARYDSGAYID